MLPGPTEVIACPHCQHPATYLTLRSGNTFGAVFYSDGKQIAPMLPTTPRVLRCADCNAVYWTADARELGSFDDYEVSPGSEDSPWRMAKRIVEPTEDELYAAIDGGLGKSVEAERELRLLAWWKRNDRLREGETHPIDQPRMSAACRRNLEALIDLLDQDEPNSALLRAELLRHLGELERAREILQKMVDGPVGWAASQILGFCDKGDTRVRPLDVASPAPRGTR
jgi:hypothetical protein